MPIELPLKFAYGFLIGLSIAVGLAVLLRLLQFAWIQVKQDTQAEPILELWPQEASQNRDKS